MCGVFVLCPALPRYCVTWDVSKVLGYLSNVNIDSNVKLII